MPSGKDRLEATLRETTPLITIGASVPRQGEETYHLAVVATALLCKAHLQARAVLSLASSPNPETAIPNLRSLLEAFGELHYLLGSTDKLVRAQTAILFALKQLREFLKKCGDVEELAKVERELEEKSRLAPRAVKSALDAGQYWTVSGRAELVNQALDTALRSSRFEPEKEMGRQLYKLLSWDEHHVMAILLTIELNPAADNCGKVKAFEAFEAPEEFLPFLAAGVMEAMLATYRLEFPAPK